MFALFLVLWLVNQSSEVRSSIAGYFANPMGFPGEAGSSLLPRDAEAASSIRPVLLETFSLRRLQLRELEERLRSRMDSLPGLESVSANIEMELVDEGLRIQLLEDSAGVFFETGRSEPKPEGRQVLQVLGMELARLPNTILIEGHTDSRRYASGASYTNWELSAERANAARRILNSNGLKDSQIGQIRGLADRQLRDPNNPLSPTNRRVTITIKEFDTGQPANSNSTADPPSRGAL
jgi:chemotaxis protein MotB